MRLDRAGTTRKLDPGAVETTEKRAPGPGPIRKVEWQPLGKKYLEGRNIIFHTDSARSYKTRLEGVKHDNVVHCKKRVKVNGKWKWQMPNYVKVTTHTVGKNKTLKTKACAQILDRAWRCIKDRLSLNQSKAPELVPSSFAPRSRGLNSNIG